MTIAVSGRVDTVTAPELEASLNFGDATCVVIDLAGVPYMSSAGLRLLLTSHKKMLAKGGEVVIHTHRTADRVAVGIFVPEDDNIRTLQNQIVKFFLCFGGPHRLFWSILTANLKISCKH